MIVYYTVCMTMYMYSMHCTVHMYVKRGHLSVIVGHAPVNPDRMKNS